MDITGSIKRIEENGHEVWVDGPKGESAIKSLEEALKIKLPPSFRKFVARYGGMAIYDSAISGIVGTDPLTKTAGTIYGDTIRFRSDHELPDHFLVIQADEDTPYCLDSSEKNRQGEYPVVCYELHSKEGSVIAADFEEWLREFFLEAWMSSE